MLAGECCVNSFARHTFLIHKHGIGFAFYEVGLHESGTYLSDADIRRLNDYHREVREKILPLLNEEEGAWLIEATREI